MATKKIKKVETPIDQRETFVSLQKNFADSEISVEEKLKTLYALQEADSAIDKIVQLRGELPAEVEALENEVADLKARLAQGTAVIEAYNQTIAENKQNIVDCDLQIEKYRKQLDDISNSREYDSINKEIENQDLLRQIAQKNINDTRSAIMAKKEDQESLKDYIAVRSEDLKAKKEELATIVESTSKEEEKLQEKRKECAAKIDPRTMSAYDRIRASVHNHLAVVSVYNGDSCGGCFSTITPQRLVD
ncbi:MAG: hypothetical protein J6N46_02465, partial [Bacteroidales bacterium]|nr:hypothetical protein [Bacteroidales bacterium]